MAFEGPGEKRKTQVLDAVVVKQEVVRKKRKTLIALGGAFLVAVCAAAAILVAVFRPVVTVKVFRLVDSRKGGLAFKLHERDIESFVVKEDFPGGRKVNSLCLAVSEKKSRKLLSNEEMDMGRHEIQVESKGHEPVSFEGKLYLFDGNVLCVSAAFPAEQVLARLKRDKDVPSGKADVGLEYLACSDEVRHSEKISEKCRFVYQNTMFVKMGCRVYEKPDEASEVVLTSDMENIAVENRLNVAFEDWVGFVFNYADRKVKGWVKRDCVSSPVGMLARGGSGEGGGRKVVELARVGGLKSYREVYRDLVEKAEELEEKGKFSDALAEFTRLKNKLPDDVSFNVLKDIGRVQYKKGEYRKADSTLEKFVRTVDKRMKEYSQFLCRDDSSPGDGCSNIQEQVKTLLQDKNEVEKLRQTIRDTLAGRDR